MAAAAAVVVVGSRLARCTRPCCQWQLGRAAAERRGPVARLRTRPGTNPRPVAAAGAAAAGWDRTGSRWGLDSVDRYRWVARAEVVVEGSSLVDWVEEGHS